MKKYLMIVLSAVFSTAASAQKVAYVDVDYVLKNMPEYTAAQEQIDNLAAAWQKDIDTKYAEIDNLYKRYEAEQVLLTDDMKQQRKKEIDDKEKAAKELQKKRFGYQGDLFQKRQELIQPIQDRVYDAIQKIATTKAYDFVLDKSSGSVVLYANTKLNISDQVLQGMGINPKSKVSEGTGNQPAKGAGTQNQGGGKTQPDTKSDEQPKTQPKQPPK
ncbi:MAG: OmpH family outer membrane protein [Chitinophagales bacterium]|nr:OmpH family outer membrane protein [Bacteroidota bacterium]MBX7140604.1 OmpH family outer membrane protein [Chitinophagales bacterium]